MERMTENLRQQYEMHDDCDELVARKCKNAVSALPAADVVPVVRCNECRHHEDEPEKLKLGDIPPKQGECWCNWWDSAVNLSGFCSRGEGIEE